MNDESVLRSQLMSSQTSRLSTYSGRHFDFLDTSHSVFSRSSYYNDKLSVHPWLRRPYSRHSGIALSTLCAGPCSSRIDELSRPRIKREYLIRQEFFDNFTNYAYSGVKPGALSAQCSERINDLARPRKKPVAATKNDDTNTSGVTERALAAHMTDRVEELAKPRYKNKTYMQSLRHNKQT